MLLTLSLKYLRIHLLLTSCILYYNTDPSQHLLSPDKCNRLLTALSAFILSLLHQFSMQQLERFKFCQIKLFLQNFPSHSDEIQSTMCARPLLIWTPATSLIIVSTNPFVTQSTTDTASLLSLKLPSGLPLRPLELIISFQNVLSQILT